MTKVFYREYYDNTLIVIEGHSGFAENGKDVVCAGVSALVFTLINCIRDEEANNRLKLHRDIVREGYVCLEIESFDFSKERISAITDTCITGLLMLGEHYPQYVRFE